MTWSPLGMVRAPSKLIVRARLIREEGALSSSPLLSPDRPAAR